MKYYFLLILLVLTFMNNSFAKTEKLKELDSMAKILVANIDHDQKICGLSAKESGIFINVVHAKIDEATKNFVDIKKHKEILSWDKTCQSECHCDFYQGILENDLSDNLIKEEYEKLKIAAGKLTEKNKLACLRKSKSLCRSALLKEIKKEAKDFAP